ncbi:MULTISPECIES: heavy metal translocating P-type ATPase [Flavobacteriaceae]|uniref:heavy metal translocating P-type ATPase n=1 Tax=Flavobacteriaceae TaxID=49546 RepID=UPI0012E677D4|nr:MULTISPECIES: heavy metal translocating P-type ATPase [Flavobacteriaceae]MBW4971342.1 cadmium-translocating P-type ATPase [Croceibacter atlanticus]MCD9620435.1 cadmium-translocating P-type ATPase [Tenacibaculum maritimum]MCD9626642.1 cadmium-translocating P-type ATPase [Tenacibaculum maritimum]MCD9629039.1 cadmium-translocating P-type ATPase [Tenacibaculum maritimum]MCD9632452.1 cadmium-translocating P-type ATPase [Tenacibaculum maritimum]
MKKKKINLRDIDPKEHKGEHSHDDGHNHSSPDEVSNLKTYLPAIFSFVMLIIGIAVDYFDTFPFFKGWVRIVWYTVAYIPVGFPVIKEGWNSIKNGDFFTEFFLMSIATLGAFAIGEYPEGVAVMLFYAVGELFQQAAVNRAKGNIKALLDVRPNEALVYRNGDFISVNPETVEIGEKIQVRVGEKVPLDGILLSDKGSFNTAALTGESKPDTVQKGASVFAGSINLDGVIEVETTKKFKDSSIARILDMVQNATARKSKTELFIRKFARVYTPIVVFLAIGLTFLPYFVVDDYVFRDWLYRALIFLVISCPCALVISIPLGYFGGLGAASRNGILFKGASFLDAMTKVNTVVMDKTGTVTKGVFKIKEVVNKSTFAEAEFMQYLMAMEEQSTHPIAKAILEYKAEGADYEATEVSEIAGKGLKGSVNGKTVLVGNKALMTSNSIDVPAETDSIIESIVMVGIDGKFAGYVTIADELKEDAHQAIKQIREAGISKIIMLSGDKDSITQQVAKELGIDWAKGGLLPEDKLNEVEKLKAQPDTTVAFIGDGINDAPVLAASDVGMAMGGLGSDVAIETADVIIQNDQPSKIARSIKIGRSTRSIVWQNIVLAFGVKIIVLILGAGGLATMWEAVFADVGVALLAILNAVRLQKMKWD